MSTPPVSSDSRPGEGQSAARTPSAIFLMGPTASGKTGLAVRLQEAFPQLEIISVDSALVYRDMNIGTAKPDAETLARAPHHLIDLIDPTESYSAAQFRNDALALMNDITWRGRIPLLVGGTMLYFNALQYGLSDLPEADPEVRGAIESEAARAGWPALHAELVRHDPETAARLQPTDAQRIQRALEVFRLTGQPLSALTRRGREGALAFRVLPLALEPSDRHVLHHRIARRFEDMLSQGLVGELRDLRACYALNPQLPSMRCVGYRQAWSFLEGEYDEETLREKGIAATRQLAKRQLTWLRGMEGVERFDCLDERLEQAVTERVARFLDAA